MKKVLVLLSTLLLHAVAVSVFAQHMPNTGDIITGVVTDSDVPIAKVHIMELDSVNDYFVTDTRTDSTGRFSFRLVKPGDRLCIHKEGFETVILPITNTYHEIKLQAQPQTVDLSEFDGLEKTVYDYVLQGPRPSETVANESVQDNMQHEYVDLGLSVKWASCNVGASKSEEYGNLYAWGETVTKYENGYTWDNYIHCNGSNNKLTKYCKNRRFGDNGFTDNKTTLDAENDVAHIKWGDNWRIPTADEWQELLDSCIMSPRTLNGVWGARFTSTVPGYEHQSIFLPFAGGTFLSNPGGTQGTYWSSSLGSFYPLGFKDDLIETDDCAYTLSIDLYGGRGVLNQMRMCGFSIRPVCP